MVKKVVCLIALIAPVTAMSTVVPYLQFRSQGFDAARELVGWQTQINKPEMCNFYGSFSITPEYTKSFKPCMLARHLFGDALIDGCAGSTGGSAWCCKKPTIKIQGSKVINRDAQALMAENFYLPTDFSSVVTFKPTIENFLVDFNLYLGLDNWHEGLYFRIHAPVVYTRWDLKFCEEIVSTGTYPYDPGYFNNTTTPAGAAATSDTSVYGLARKNLLHSFKEFVSDQGAITGVDDITYNSLNNARMSACRRHKTGVAEVTAALGCNFVDCPDYTVGFNMRAAAPTGNRPAAEWLFEPIVGQGKHWEFGGGLDTRWVWWRSCDEEQDFTVYLDANITHLFKACQWRTFDLCNKPLSRYMLAMTFTDQVSNLYAGSAFTTAVAPDYQFAKVFTPLANLTTLPVNVSAAVQGEFVIKFAYTHCNWQCDIGYDFWGRSCEKICKRSHGADCGIQDNTWALKGDAFTFGFTSVGSVIATTGTPLSASQSNATIFSGANNYGASTTVGSVSYAWNENPGIDNPAIAWASNTVSTPLFTHQMYSNTGAGAPLWNNVLTSYQPIFLQESDLDISCARARSMSNKIFAHVGYTWKECACLTPYLGFGCEAEFGMWNKKDDGQCNTYYAVPTSGASSSTGVLCTSAHCNTVSLSQWGVWCKGGVSFN